MTSPGSAPRCPGTPSSGLGSHTVLSPGRSVMLWTHHAPFPAGVLSAGWVGAVTGQGAGQSLVLLSAPPGPRGAWGIALDGSSDGAGLTQGFVFVKVSPLFKVNCGLGLGVYCTWLLFFLNVYWFSSCFSHYIFLW